MLHLNVKHCQKPKVHVAVLFLFCFVFCQPVFSVIINYKHALLRLHFCCPALLFLGWKTGRHSCSVSSQVWLQESGVAGFETRVVVVVVRGCYIKHTACCLVVKAETNLSCRTVWCQSGNFSEPVGSTAGLFCFSD